MAEPFSLSDVRILKEGVLAESEGFKPLSKLGVDFTLRPETVFGALPAVGGFVNIGQAISKVQTEDAANRILGRDRAFGQTFKDTATKDSATNQVIQAIKQSKAKNDYSTSPNITRDDIQNYIMKQTPELNLAPIQYNKFTNQQLINQGIDSAYVPKQQYNTQPFSDGLYAKEIGYKGVGTSPSQFDDYDKEAFAFDEDGEKYGLGVNFGQAIKSGEYDDRIKSTDQFAEDKINQVNFGTRDAEGNFKGAKGYDPAFARAVTVENQDDAPSESTFICTVLYDMNDMPISIYKYDQRYGQQVNRKIYNGYATWGKPIAQKMRNQGILYKIIKPIALKWAEQMAYDMSDGKVGKKRYAIKVMKFLGETICYSIGLFIKPEGAINGNDRNRQHGKERTIVRRKDGVSKKRGGIRTKRRTAS